MTQRLDRPPLRPELRDFVDWVARWTLAPRGMALRLATRAAEEAAPETPRVGYRLAGPPPERMTPARARVIAAAEGGLVFAKGELARAAGCSAGVVDALVDEGTLEAVAAAARAGRGAARSRFRALRAGERAARRRRCAGARR